MGAETRAAWRTEITRGSDVDEGAPSWLWSSVVELAGRHEVGLTPGRPVPASGRLLAGVAAAMLQVSDLVAPGEFDHAAVAARPAASPAVASGCRVARV
jgi:hypothetical protein